MPDLTSAQLTALSPPIESLIHAIHKQFPESMRRGYPCVPSDHVEEITEVLMTLIAELVVDYIDAGSERDAVHENEVLHNAIRDELNGWNEKEV